jgi:hypothetical protein
VHPVSSVALWFTRRVNSFEGFVGNLFEIRTWVSLRGSYPTNGSVSGWNCKGLSEQDPWKKCAEDESI